MDMQNIGIYIPGLAIIFFYAMSQFNRIPLGGKGVTQDASTVLSTLRQWFQYKELPPPLISPPLRANTTAFKYWLYRFTYALIWVLVYTAIIRLPGVREPLPAIFEAITGNGAIYKLNLTNGVVVAFVIMLLTRIPPFRGADATIRQAMYERAAIPAQQFGFQSLLRGAPYEPGKGIVRDTAKNLEADGFDAKDIGLDLEPTTRSLWTKISILMRSIESWSEKDQYKTALALLREPGSDKLTEERVRSDYEALKSNARIYLDELQRNLHTEETRLREEHFRRDCKAMLDSIYSLLTRVALRSHYSYFDAIAAIRKIGFTVEGTVAPLPDKNDVVALSMLLFFITTIPLAYRLGAAKALSITGIYLLAALTPIYLAAECPRLLKKKQGGMPPLTFPLTSGLVAGLLAAAVSIAMGSMCEGNQCFRWLGIGKGIDRLLHVSYPWVIMVCFLTALLATVMLVGEYASQDNPNKRKGYRKWGSFRDAVVISGGVITLMALSIIPELHHLAPDRFPHALFLKMPGLMLIPAVTSFFLGFFVPTWYRGNALRIREEERRPYVAKSRQVQDVPVMH